MQLTVIQKRIYVLDGQRVMLDFDIAELYQVETRVLNQAVNRNLNRFPKDFMRRLTAKEWASIQFQMQANNSSQFVMSSKKHRGKAYLPLAFTEQGVSMLASVLRSERAVKTNIFIIRAFVALRQFSLNYKELATELKEIRERVGVHDKHLEALYNAFEMLLAEKQQKVEWDKRERIGFKRGVDVLPAVQDTKKVKAKPKSRSKEKKYK